MGMGIHGLVRARVVFETQDLGPRVRAIIDDALTRPRDIEATKATVAEMRGRIEKTHGTKCIWAIKQVAGGQVDIDFISQYLVLAHTHAHPGHPKHRRGARGSKRRRAAV